jgi:benzoate membrane transport protein
VTERHPLLTAISAALPAMMIFVAVLSVPLSVAPALGLDEPRLASWLLAIYAFPGLLGLWLSLTYRQPLLLTGNLLSIIIIASAAEQLSVAELAGASLVAGGGMIVLGALGLTVRLANLIPVPIVLGLLAGAAAPFVLRIATGLVDAPLVVGSALVAFVAGWRLLPSISPVVPALVAGVTVVVASGQLGEFQPIALTSFSVTMPSLSLAAIATIAPLLMVVMTLQSTVPSLVYLRGQGFDPPERQVVTVSGLGTVAGSLLGPIAVAVPLPVTPLVGGPAAGRLAFRYRAAIVASTSLVIIGLFAGLVAGLAVVITPALIQALAGLALVGVLTTALQQVLRGPLRLGPAVAFVITLSGLSLLGIGSFFWALLAGLLVSVVFEAAQLRVARAPAVAVGDSSA